MYATLGPPADEFLVLSKKGALELRSTSGTKRQLVRHADEALYDSALELVWLVDKGDLRVLDLRVARPAPVLIAEGLPEGARLAVAREGHVVERQDGCDVPSVTLQWGPQSTLDGDAPDAHVTNQAWLRKQLGRSFDHLARLDSGFADAPRAPLSGSLARCEDRDSCGASARFGNAGLRLVKVRESMHGGCFHRACVLWNWDTKQFAAPTGARVWGAAEEVMLGSCGLYMFDAMESAYLLGDELCSGEVCTSLEGQALGWLAPGSVVGQPGVLDDDHSR